MNFFFKILPFILSITLLSFLVSRISFNFVDIFKNINFYESTYIFIFLSVLLVYLSFIIIAYRFKFIMKDFFKISISSYESLRININSFFLSILFNFALTADIYRFNVLRKYNLDFKSSIEAVLIDRVIAMLFLIIIGFFVFSFDDSINYLILIPEKIRFSLGIFLACLIYLYLSFYLNKKFNFTFKATFAFFKLLFNVFFYVFVYAFLLFLITKIFTITVPFKIILLTSPFILFFQNLPLFFVGFGSREACMLYFLSGYAEQKLIFLVSLTIGFIYIFSTFVSIFDFRRLSKFK